MTATGETASGVGETHVLVPTLREDRVSVVLESGLENETHYTAGLLFDSQHITTNFCECVQYNRIISCCNTNW